MARINVLVAASIGVTEAALKNLENFPTPHSNVGF
jgi:hypothetical protein